MKEQDIINLIQWYQKEKRDLPWRHTSDPYHILISEVMLQQTRVETVKKYYERFLAVLPTVKDLANVKEDTLLKLWEGLGYYNRARNLKKCAQEIIKRGLTTLPDNQQDLSELPGIGPYTEGAILSIAYKKCVPAIDGNVLRVLTRVYEDNREITNKDLKEEYFHILKGFMTEENARDFTESFMELGALICVPNKIPLCEKCPLKNTCQSYLHKTMSNYPVKERKKERKVKELTVYILTVHRKIAIKKRKKDLLNGLYELPNIEKKLTKEELQNFLQKKGYKVKKIIELTQETHLFTHIKWLMTPFLVELEEEKNFSFYSKKEIEEKYSLPTAFAKILKKIPF